MHLVVIDAQNIFADPCSDWGAPRFASAWLNITRLAKHFGTDVVLTRWLPTAQRENTSWEEYFRTWPFADVHPEHELYQLIPEAQQLSSEPSVDESTFSKWGDVLATRVGPTPHLVLTGVSTDCCVINTALAAADSGAWVTVISDACAGSDDANHAAALHIMGLNDPQIRVKTTEEFLCENH